MKSGFHWPQIEIQPTTGAIVEWQSYNYQNQIKSSTEGQEPRNVEVRKFKQEAKWQSISWNHGKESNEVNSPDRHGNWSTRHKANKRNLKERYSFKWSAPWMQAEKTRQKLWWRPPVDRLLKQSIIRIQHLSHRQECDGGIKLKAMLQHTDSL